MTAPRLSVVVITLDEEAKLRRCLESVAWGDEVVVVDAESKDKTVQIAREFTDRVIARPWPGFAAQKNFALEQATGDWVLSLDADEEASPELRAEIAATVTDPRACDGYALRRRNVFFGRWIRHGGLYPDWQLRLFRRASPGFGGRPQGLRRRHLTRVRWRLAALAPGANRATSLPTLRSKVRWRPAARH